MIIHNDRVIRRDQPETGAWNRSFRYGDGLFETIRLFRGQPLLLSQHLDRLRKGMLLLGFEFDANAWDQRMRAAIDQWLSQSEWLGPGRLRLHVWRTGEGAYAPTDNQPAYLLEGFFLKEELYETLTTVSLTDFHGVTLHQTPLSAAKTASALPYVLAARHAKEAGHDEALLFHHSGAIAEASAANLFLFQGNRLLTPPLSSGCLPGIMRAQVLQLVEHFPYTIQETSIHPKDLLRADAAFLTNVIRGIMPVRQYRQREWGHSDWAAIGILQKSWLQLARSFTQS